MKKEIFVCDGPGCEMFVKDFYDNKTRIAIQPNDSTGSITTVVSNGRDESGCAKTIYNYVSKGELHFCCDACLLRYIHKERRTR